jgi:hypothetical protein
MLIASDDYQHVLVVNTRAGDERSDHPVGGCEQRAILPSLAGLGFFLSFCPSVSKRWAIVKELRR